MAINIFLFTLGLILIIVGGNFFVDAAVWLSEKLLVPKFIIGATIVSLATTLPELIVSIIATLSGKYEMAAGNAIGSIVANIGLILAISIAVMPCEVKKSGLILKSCLLLGSAFVTLFFSTQGTLGIIPAAILLLLWLSFMAINLIDGKRAEDAAPSLHTPVSGKEIAISMIKFGLGTAGLVFGSDLLVDQGSAIASSLGVPEGIIAVTIVAIGTSLPELVTTITALCKKQASLSIGNILGANIMDIALIMPVCAFISGGLIISRQTLLLDLPACILLTIVAFNVPACRKKYSRAIGISLLIMYAIYLTLLLTFFK
ncbi:MAG: calcium/sodium antiporter [Clostridiales bacterium]|nr:calcium/sodium antiporter [Clostridiales bacterium]